MPEPQRLSAQVRAVMACALARPSDDLDIRPRPALAHQSNRLYDVRVNGAHLIAKEYPRPEEPDAADHEFRALQLVEPLDIAPKPVFFDPFVGRVY